MQIRKAIINDIPEMHRVRLAVTENRLTHTVISADDYVNAISRDGCGWIARLDGALRGFAVAKRQDGNIWALFVEPGYEGRGIGRALHEAMLAWLAGECETAWLVTEPGTRAERFYRQAGWRFVETTPEGDARYERRLR